MRLQRRNHVVWCRNGAATRRNRTCSCHSVILYCRHVMYWCRNGTVTRHNEVGERRNRSRSRRNAIFNGLGVHQKTKNGGRDASCRSHLLSWIVETTVDEVFVIEFTVLYC